jgi:hypothetical protein
MFPEEIGGEPDGVIVGDRVGNDGAQGGGEFGDPERLAEHRQALVHGGNKAIVHAGREDDGDRAGDQELGHLEGGLVPEHQVEQRDVGAGICGEGQGRRQIGCGVGNRVPQRKQHAFQVQCDKRLVLDYKDTPA